MVHRLRHNKVSATANRLLRLLAASICLCSSASSLAIAQGVHGRFPLSTTQIVDAMRERQMITEGVQLSLSVPITTIAANPLLEIRDIAPVNAHEFRLRIACRDSSECLPFFATATYPEASGMSAPHAKADQPPIPVRALPAARAITEAPASSTAIKAANSGEPPLLRSGSPATLDFDGERVHVRVEVICLESGATGDKIHVTTRDHKQIYVAEIVAPRALKGTLTR
jgi:hypothetical protein